MYLYHEITITNYGKRDLESASTLFFHTDLKVHKVYYKSNRAGDYQ